MRDLFYDFQIDGKPILVPDNDITVEPSDLHDADTGRDECGYMHIIVLRESLAPVPLSYATLTAEEYMYMESLFKGKATVMVEYRGIDGETHSFEGYRSKYSITIHNARTGQCKNYRFNIVPC